MTYTMPLRPGFTIAMVIVDEAARINRLSPHDILRRNRTRRFSHVRFGVIWVLRQIGMSCLAVRDHLGFDDHTSVLYGDKWAKQRREYDPDFTQWTDDLLAFALDRQLRSGARAA